MGGLGALWQKRLSLLGMIYNGSGAHKVFGFKQMVLNIIEAAHLHLAAKTLKHPYCFSHSLIMDNNIGYDVTSIG